MIKLGLRRLAGEHTGRRLVALLAAVASALVLGVTTPANAVSSAGAGSNGSQSIDQYLGSAGPAGAGAPWAMISLGNFTANGPGVNNGNVAVASGAATLNTPFSINGILYLGQGVSYSSNVTPSGGVTSNPSLVSQAASDARTASSTFSAMTPTQTVGTLGNFSTLSGSSGFNVINTSGVNLTNGPLTLSGSSSSIFVINVNGDFSVSNGGVVLSGGVLATNVVWNISGSLTITGGGAGGATFYGTALVVNGAVTVHDDTWNGEIIGATITDTSGFTVNAFPPAPITQTISGHIYKCVGGKPSVVEVAGGTLGATGPQTVATQPNPLGPLSVLAGTYTMTATAPPAYRLVLCGTSSPDTRTVVVPSGGTGVGLFYVVAITQTISGHIYLCKAGVQTTTEVAGGTLGATGPQTVATQPNPLGPVGVKAGTYTMTASAPSGYELVACGGVPGTPTQTVVVPPGGTGVGRFYVSLVAPPPSGYIEICKQQSGTGLTGQLFTFSVAGRSVTVPVGACSPALKVASGDVTVTEVTRTDSTLVGVSTIPSSRLVSANLSTRVAVVKVVAGSSATETIVTFTNTLASGSGYLKVCAVAGAGVPVGTNIDFTRGATTVTVPAGPAPGGYCVIMGQYAYGQKTVTETVPAGDKVSAISVSPANRRVSTSLSGGYAVVVVASGVTEVTFTTSKK